MKKVERAGDKSQGKKPDSCHVHTSVQLLIAAGGSAVISDLILDQVSAPEALAGREVTRCKPDTRQAGSPLDRLIVPMHPCRNRIAVGRQMWCRRRDVLTATAEKRETAGQTQPLGQHPVVDRPFMPALMAS